jgi:pullulanase/glycogen debranching enzyme
MVSGLIRGLTNADPSVPKPLRGTYAGAALVIQV